MQAMTANETRYRKYIGSVRWQFAKTYADTWPHEYTIREWTPDQEQEFVWFAQYIREHGITRPFFKRMHTYFEVDEWEYWTMGEPIDEIVVLNRALIANRKPALC